MRSLYITAVFFFLIFGFASSSSARETAALRHGPDYDGGSIEGVIIDSIEIDNRNVYDTRKPEYDNLLFRTANRLHVVTRESVIRRELLFDIGEPFSTELAEETARNLRARYELYDAWIEPRVLDDGRLLVRVVTIDLWSFLVAMRVKREGNETNYQFGIEERNFLGYGQFMSLDYFVQEKDKNYPRTIYSNPRMWGGPYIVGVEYNDDPTSYVRRFSFKHPYYNLSQRYSFGFGIYDRGGRKDQYFDNQLIAQSHNRGDQVALWGGYRWGEYKRKMGVIVSYDYVYETTRDKDTLMNDYADQVAFPSDSLYHRLLLRLSLERLEFATLKRINGFSYTEDFTLGQTVAIEGGRAFGAGFNNYLYDQLGVVLSHGSQIGTNLVMASYERNWWFRQGKDYRDRSSFSLRWYNNGLDFLTVAFRGLYVSDWDREGRNYLVLGGTTGLRGYDRFFRTGNRLMLFNLENRFYPQVELLSVIFGGAVFADVGRVWRSGDPLKLSNFHSSIGAGLRISLEKSAKGELVRIDAAYGQDHSWEFSIGTGQYF